MGGRRAEKHANGNLGRKTSNTCRSTDGQCVRERWGCYYCHLQKYEVIFKPLVCLQHIDYIILYYYYYFLVIITSIIIIILADRVAVNTSIKYFHVVYTSFELLNTHAVCPASNNR